MQKYKIAVISIGNELLAGKTANSNLQYLAQELIKLGLKIDFAPITGDRMDLLQETIDLCWSKYDIVLTTGGLGPTSDDITKQAVAEYFQQKIVFDDEVWEKIQQRFNKMPMPSINRKQAERPQFFKKINNDLGSSPGLYYKIPSSESETETKLIMLLPGVPAEMKHVFVTGVVPLLNHYSNLETITVKTVHTIDIPESALAEKIEGIFIPGEVELAYLPHSGKVDVRVTGTNKDEVNRVFEGIINKVQSHTWGVDDESLPQKVHDFMINNKLSLSLAESCTGGLIQQMLTAIPNTSLFFQGGMIVYSNKAKTCVLGVDENILKDYGAVSAETAVEMAEKVRKLFKTDIGLSVTGIAGPGGGTKDKPAGTVCFALSYRDKTEVHRKYFRGDREIVRMKAANYLLYLVIKKTLINR